MISDADCRFTVAPPPLGAVTERKKWLAAFVGFVPAKNSWKLFAPSLSGSHVAQDWRFYIIDPLTPKYKARHASEIPSFALLVAVTETPAENCDVFPAESVAVAVKSVRQK